MRMLNVQLHAVHFPEREDKRTKKPLNYIRHSVMVDSVVTSVNGISDYYSDHYSKPRIRNGPRIRLRFDMLCFSLLLFITRFYIIFHTSAASPLQQTCDLRAPLLSVCYAYTRRCFRLRVSSHQRICNEFYGSHVHRFHLAKRNSTPTALTVMPVKSAKEKSVLKIWGTYILDKKQSCWKTMVYFFWICDTIDLIYN